MDDVTAVILGGGRGTRLFPLTLERAKPAVGFAGKYRLIDIPISNCINSGIKRMFVLTQFMSASLHRHIMQTYQFDTFSDGFVDILAAEQTPSRSDWFQGTADAVRATLNHTTYFDSRQNLILSGDHLYRMDYSQLIKAHRESRADITLCVYPCTREEAPRMGLLKVDPNRIVTEFVEKPKDPAVIDRFTAPSSLFGINPPGKDEPKFLSSMGIYVFEPKIMAQLLNESSEPDFGKEIIPNALGKHRVVAYPYFGYWKDIGTIDAFYDSNLELAKSDPPFKMYHPKWPIYTRSRTLPPSRVIHSVIQDSLLAEGADINGATIKNSVIGTRSMIRENTELDGVVMMGADFYQGEQVLTSWDSPDAPLPALGIGTGCRIKKAIIDKNARIGNDVIIEEQPEGKEHQSDNYWIIDGITCIPKGAVLPSGMKI